MPRALFFEFPRARGRWRRGERRRCKEPEYPNAGQAYRSGPPNVMLNAVIRSKSKIAFVHRRLLIICVDIAVGPVARKMSRLARGRTSMYECDHPLFSAVRSVDESDLVLLIIDQQAPRQSVPGPHIGASQWILGSTSFSSGHLDQSVKIFRLPIDWITMYLYHRNDLLARPAKNLMDYSAISLARSC